MNLGDRLQWASACSWVLGEGWLSANAVSDPILHGEQHAERAPAGAVQLPLKAGLLVCVLSQMYSPIADFGLHLELLTHGVERSASILEDAPDIPVTCATAQLTSSRAACSYY